MPERVSIHGGPGMPEREHGNPALHEQFENIEQQRDAGTFGIWIFLATEILFFGGLFTAYIQYRAPYFSGFLSGSRLLERPLGALMTFVLLGSSLTMALSVHSIRVGRQKRVILFLILTIILGVAFLGIKFTEYHNKWEEHLVPGFNWHPTAEQLEGAPPQHVELFLCFYFFMTGLHALHMIVGIGLLAVMAVLTWLRKITVEHYNRIEVSGLYWHFVDIIWIYLFPLLYLIEGARK
jgi:cytochrome c oxidase subunit III